MFCAGRAAPWPGCGQPLGLSGPRPLFWSNPIQNAGLVHMLGEALAVTAWGSTTPTFSRFVTQTWELSDAWLVLSIVEVDMWLAIVAVTFAIAIASCVAAAMMQPRQGRELPGGG